MTWDVLTTDFGGDETVNFGPRKEAGTALFQIDTIATLSCQEQEESVPSSVKSAVLGDLTCFAVEKSLVMKSTSILNFESEIDEIEWSPDGRFLVVGDNGGNFVVISGETDEILQSFPLIKEDRKVDGRAFRKILFSGEGSLVVLAVDGYMMVLQDVSVLMQVLYERSKQQTREGGNITDHKDKLMTVETSSYHETCVNDVVIQGNYVYTMGAGDYVVCKWGLQQNTIELIDCMESYLENDASIKQGCLTTDGNFLFLLDTNGCISVLDTMILTCIDQYTQTEMIDICLLETQTSLNNSLDGVRLITITGPTENHCDVNVLSLPNWELVYNLQLASQSHLAKCNTLQDDLYVTELCRDESEVDESLTVRFRCLKETDPKTRLHRILQKNRFEEAMMFARLFNLDTELVYKVKCNFLLDELSPWKTGKYDDDVIKDMTTQFWDCLEKIDDHLHVVECCMMASLPTFAETEALQLYCTKLLNKVDTKDASALEKKQLLKLELLMIHHKLMTYKMAFGEKMYTSEKWERFVHADLLQESLTLIQDGQTEKGFIIWAQHQAEWTDGEINTELIQQILATVTYTTPALQLRGYISTAFLPVIVREVPDTLNILIEHVIEKAKSMETTDKKTWTRGAIDFCDFVIQHVSESIRVSLDEETCMASETAHKLKYKLETMLEPLSVFRVRLQQLDDIIHRYNCLLSLTQFLQETTETITFRMLDKVHAIELIVPTLEKQIRPYMTEHGLNQDHIFSKYIKDLLERQGQIRSYIGEVTWEAKSVAIIDCISDPEQKIEGIMEVMKWAPIPWSKEIEKLVDMGLQLKNSGVQKLKDQCERVHIRKLLMRYGMKNIDLPLGRDAEHLAYVMVRQDEPGCVEDALEVMRFCGVRTTATERELYKFRCRDLIVADRLEECLELLKSLPTTMGLDVGNGILLFTTGLLDYDVIYGDKEKAYAEKRLFTDAAIHINKYLQTIEQDFIEREDLKCRHEMFRNILSLQQEYELYPSVQQFEDEKSKLKMVYSYTKTYLAAEKKVKNASFAKLYRLGRLLQIPDAVFQGKMAVELANAGNIQTATDICRDLYECNPTAETAATLYEVASAFVSMQAELDIDNDDVDTDKLRMLPELCSRLANQAVIICSPDKMLQYLELSKECSLLLAISQQCESGDVQLSEQWNEGKQVCLEKGREMFRELTKEFYQEDSLSMTSTAALPLASKYIAQCSLFSEQPDKNDENEDLAGGDFEESKDKDVYSMQCSKVIPVVQHLRDNGHLQLAFSFSLHMLNNLLQHSVQQDMGLPIVNEDRKADVEVHKKAFLQINSHSQTLLKDLVFTIATKVYNAPKMDVKLALSYLTMFNQRTIMDIMKKLIRGAGHQYKKLKSVAALGVALGELYREVTLIDTCRQLETNAQWGYRLSKIKVCFKDVLHGQSLDKQKLLPVIAKSELADTQLVKEYCQDFGLDQDEGLLLYLDALFNNPDEGTTSTHDKHTMLTKVKETLPEIQCQDVLMSKMRAIYFRTSCYDYESLEVLFDILKTQKQDNIPVEKGIKLLEYLKVYTRNAKPTDYEVEYKSMGAKKEAQIFLRSLPEESKQRLPLHPLLHGDAWKILTAELKKESIQTWLLISKLLDLSSEQICMTAVQNMIKNYAESCSHLDKGTDLSVWHWDPDQANKVLLQEAKEVLENIKNCESFLACGQWMVKNLPLGSEKVQVLQECVKYAELWHLSIPEESAKRERARMAYLKFYNHWKKMESARILCTHNLGEADLLQMTEKPTQLIQRLYEHPSISQLKWEKSFVKPDIHGAVARLAELNQIDIEGIQSTMLNQLLQTSSGKQQESEETMTFNLDNLKLSETFIETETDEDIILKRIVHLMEKGSKVDNILAIDNAAEGSDTLSCIRALSCLLHVADEETLKSVRNKTINEVRDHLYVMLYIAGLEKLHVKYSVATFLTCQKESLVRGLWKNHSHEKRAACLVSSLCLDYKIYDRQLWSSILQRLHSFGLVKQLEYVLLKLNNIPELWLIQPFSKMWYNLVSYPLSKVCAPLSFEQTNTCVHYFNLLLSCPVLRELSLDNISHQYQKLELYGCALGCLLHGQIQGEDASQVTNLIQHNAKKILNSLPNLLRSGLQYGISQMISHAVYEFIITSERFEVVMGSADQTPFVTYCVKEKKIDGLLAFGIKHKMLEESKKLIGLFCSTYPNINMQLAGYIDDEEDEEEKDQLLVLLKAYLRMQNMHGIAMTVE